ncbi:MAG: PAS domain S-box protein [Methanoregula sp.]|nr:MAG: PAS domain S-box protein [Methanoregula sp.]
MTGTRESGSLLTENGWRVLLLSTSVLILLFTVYCLAHGITIIFMHLYYFPIILLAYHYHKKGVILSAVLGLLYVALVTFFVFPDMEVIAGALVRFVVFVGIAAVVSYLSETLKKRELERNTIIANSEDGIFVVDMPLRMITEVNRRGAGMLGYTTDELVNQPLDTIWHERQELIRCSDLISSAGFARNFEVHLVQKSGETRTVLLSAGALPEHRVVLTVTDITDRELMLSEMRRLSDVRESIIKNANVWLMLIDPRGRILEWNKAAEEISGYAAAEVTGSNAVWKLLYPEKIYRKEITEKISGIIKRDNYLENLQSTIVAKNGTKKTLLWNTRGLPDSKGTPGNYIAIGIDITDREKAGQVSREYAEWYSTLLRTTRDGYNLVDAKGRLIEVNDNYCRMTGFSREELLGRSISDQDANESKDAAVAHMQKILKTGSDRFETRHRTKDGGIIDVEVSVSFQAQKRQFIVFVRDITERKRAEKEIYESEAKFHTIADFTSDWEYWQAEDKQIIYMTPSCERITGYTPEEFFADLNLLETIVHPDDLSSMQEHNRVAWETRQVLSKDFRIMHRDGTVRWIGHACRHVYDAEGNAVGRRVSNRDITDRKRLEISLTESEGRLKEILESMIAGVVIIDPETHTIVDLNSVAARMIGARKDQIVGSVCHRYICPAEIGACPITDPELTVDKSEKVLLTHHGEKIPILKSVVPITINERPHLLESFIDISDLKQAESTLRESEEKYRAFFNTSRDCVFITTADGRWVDLNDGAVELFGYGSREELLQVNIRDLYANPGERTRHIDIIRQKGFTRDFPIELRKKDGSVINTLITSVVRKDKNGNVVGFQGTVRDITEKKATQDRIEVLLHLQEEQLRIINTSPAVAFLWKAEENWPVEMVSRNISQFGYSVNDFVSGSVLYSSIIHPDDLGQVAAEVEYNSKNNIDEFKQIYRIFGKDRSEYWIDDYTHIRRDKDGKITHYEGIVIDITERKMVEKALAQSEYRYRILAESAQDVIFIINPDLKFSYMNSFGADQFGKSPGELTGMLLQALFPQETFEKISAIIHQVVERGKTQHIEMEIPLPSSHRWYDTHFVPLLDKDGDVFSILGISRDITELKDKETALKKAHDELEMRVRERTAELAHVNIELEDEITERKRINEHITKLSAVKEGLLAALSLNEKLKLITEGVVEIFNADFARIWMTRDSDLCEKGCQHAAVTEGPHVCRDRTRCLHLMASSGRYTHIDGGHRRVPMGAYKIGRVATAEHPGFVTNDVINDPRVHDHEWARSLGLVSFAGYRLSSAEGRPIGVIALFSKNKIEPWEEKLLEDIASTASQVILKGMADDALKESEERFRSLVETTSDFVWEVNQDGKFIYVSPKVRDLLGYEPEEVIGKTPFDLMPPDEAEKTGKIFLEIVAGQKFIVGLESINLHKDGQRVVFETNGVPFFDTNRNLLGYRGIARDITGRKAAEEQIVKSLHEKEFLLREVHHRVRNNFQIIISLLSLQSRSIGDEVCAAAMQESQNRIRAMAFVHEKLYTSQDLAKIELEPYIKYLTTQLFTLFKVPPRTIGLVIDATNIFADINTTIPFGLIVNELVSNSLKHAFPGGRKGEISISVRDDKKGLTLSYRDNGVGFGKDFDWRTTDTLGFKLIIGLVEQLDGTIEQQPGEGTRFEITIKRKTDEKGKTHGTFNPVPE